LPNSETGIGEQELLPNIETGTGDREQALGYCPTGKREYKPG